MRTTRLIEQQQLSEHHVQLLEQQLVSKQTIVQPHEQTVEHPEHQLRTQPAEQPPLDAFMFVAWTTIYSMYRLYFAVSYERPLPVQIVASNVDFRFNVGNFKFQVAGDCIRNGAIVTGRGVVVMSTIFAMVAAAFLGFIVNALKKNN
jgi:hypothetical protein